MKLRPTKIPKQLYIPTIDELVVDKLGLVGLESTKPIKLPEGVYVTVKKLNYYLTIAYKTSLSDRSLQRYIKRVYCFKIGNTYFLNLTQALEYYHLSQNIKSTD